VVASFAALPEAVEGLVRARRAQAVRAQSGPG